MLLRDLLAGEPPTEQLERTMLMWLHERGSTRTGCEEYWYRKVVAKYGAQACLTIDVYSSFLKLHAKNDERSDEEETEYQAMGNRFRLHGRPELRRFDRKPTCLLACQFVLSADPPRSRSPRPPRSHVSHIAWLASKTERRSTRT